MLRVGEALVDLLARGYGVDTVFGIPGAHTIELYRGLHRSGVRVVTPRHEQGAGFMADGWGLVTGRVGVCTLISGPGLTNALTPIAQAFHDSRPMLVVTSCTPRDALGRKHGGLHDLDDQAGLAASVTAFSSTVLDPAQVPQLLARAWDVFSSGRPRPVHLALPIDVLELEVDPFERVPSAAARPQPDPDAVAAAAAVLAGAPQVMVVAGGGTVDAGTELAVLAELLDAPVVLSGNAKGVLPSDHPLCVGAELIDPGVQRALEQAPAVLVVGAELSDADLFNGGRPLAFGGAVVRVDLDPEQLDRRADPQIGLVADAAPALAALAEAVRGLRHPAGIHSGAAGSGSPGGQRAAALQAAARDRQPAGIRRWVDALATALPPDVVVALDSTQLGYPAHRLLPALRPRSWLAPYGYGTLGCALPMAVGAGIGAPGRPLLAVAGDGGWLFTVAELATAVDEGLDLVLVLWDNRGYGMIRWFFDRAGAPRTGTDASAADPVGIARGFGWQACSVDTPRALTEAVAEAFAAGGCRMVHVRAPSDEG